MSPTVTSTKQIQDIDEWTSAMLIFGAIYAERYPQESPALFKYIKVVRDLKLKCYGARWTYYDIQFRKLKSQMEWTWDFINWELYFAATSQKVQQQSTSNNNIKRPQSFRVPKGYCWNHQRDASCSNSSCPWKHECCICHGSHSAKFCQQRKTQFAKNGNTQRSNTNKSK